MDGAHDHDDHSEDHDKGFAFDLRTLLQRRQALVYLAGAGAAAAIGYGWAKGGDSGSAAAAASTTTPQDRAASSGGSTGASADGAIPEETAGPYPADGSNGVNVLTESGVLRSDIRASFGAASGVADGVPLSVTLTVTDVETGDPIPGAAVYLWHCDRAGEYSMYSQSIRNENYLRGVQEADNSGQVAFVSIFPGCYSGRWPHIHFEVYPSLDEATAAGSPLTTTQLAFPADVCDTVYATDGYEQSVTNLARTSLDGDMVFSDGWDQQLATMTGEGSPGFLASLTVPV